MTQARGHGRPVKTAGLVAYSLMFTGLFLIMVSILGSETWHWPVWVSAFVRDVGLLLAAVIAGTIVHEKLLRDEMMTAVVEELDQKLEARVPKLSDISDSTATEVHRLFSERPPEMTGIRLLSEVRRNFSEYYKWVNEQRPQELFFAGRSVLHRIDADIRTRTETSAETVIFRRLKEGAKIKILFLDPRTNILDRLAKEEGQTLQAMLGDIATSIGICQRVFDLLQKNFLELPPSAELSIRVYDRVPYFAYHKQDDQVIVGFYFLSTKGYASSAYELIDEVTKQVFGDHFVRIMSEAATNTLVEFDGARGRPSYDHTLFQELCNCLYLPEHLGKERAEELMERRRSSVM